MGTLLKSPSFLGDFFFFLSDSTLRLLPSTFGRRKRAEVSLKRAVLHPRATKMYESVAQACRAAPSGDEDVRKCRPSVPCCTLGRRKSAKVLPKRAVLHPWATKMYESVAQACRAALLGDDKCGFRCRRVSFIHTSFCPAPLGNGKARKSRLTVPRVTFGCGTVRRHRSRGARRRLQLLSLEGFRGRSHGRAAIISAIISGIFV